MHGAKSQTWLLVGASVVCLLGLIVVFNMIRPPTYRYEGFYTAVDSAAADASSVQALGTTTTVNSSGLAAALTQAYNPLAQLAGAAFAGARVVAGRCDG